MGLPCTGGCWVSSLHWRLLSCAILPLPSHSCIAPACPCPPQLYYLLPAPACPCLPHTTSACLPLPAPHRPCLLAPACRAGEEVELQVRYLPRAVGRSVVLGICDLEGSSQPTGFSITSQVKVGFRVYCSGFRWV